MKKEGKKWMLVALALLALVMVALPLVGCKNDTVAEQTGDGTGSGGGNQGSGDGNQGTGDGTGSGGGNQGTGDGTGSGDGNQGTGGETEVTVDNVSTVIEGLTGEEPHTLVVTGELKDLSAITTALSSNKSAKVNLDLSKVSGLKTIGIDAFSGCSGLTSISIPSSVEIIRDFAFDGCSGLTSINIPEGVTTIGAWAFEGCSDLTSISIPSSVTSIGDAAFYGCSSLNISVSEKNTKYSSVNGMLLNKEKTILIADPSAKVTVNNVPTSVTTIGNYAFSGCSGLTRISIPSSVTSIGEYAFDGWRSLTSISIPSSVTSIGEYAFAGCRGTTVKVEAENPPILGSGVFEDVSKILVPSGFVDTYKEKWSDYEGKIEAISDQTS